MFCGIFPPSVSSEQELNKENKNKSQWFLSRSLALPPIPSVANLPMNESEE